MGIGIEMPSPWQPWRLTPLMRFVSQCHGHRSLCNCRYLCVTKNTAIFSSRMLSSPWSEANGLHCYQLREEPPARRWTLSTDSRRWCASSSAVVSGRQCSQVARNIGMFNVTTADGMAGDSAVLNQAIADVVNETMTMALVSHVLISWYRGIIELYTPFSKDEATEPGMQKYFNLKSASYITINAAATCSGNFSFCSSNSGHTSRRHIFWITSTKLHSSITFTTQLLGFAFFIR